VVIGLSWLLVAIGAALLAVGLASGSSGVLVASAALTLAALAPLGVAMVRTRHRAVPGRAEREEHHGRVGHDEPRGPDETDPSR
jgi:hypothetical protein